MRANEPGLLALQEDLVELEGRVRALHGALGAARAALFPPGSMPVAMVNPAPVIKPPMAPVAPPLPPELLRPAVEVLKPPEVAKAPVGHDGSTEYDHHTPTSV